jgi:hypothetical protein
MEHKWNVTAHLSGRFMFISVSASNIHEFISNKIIYLFYNVKTSCDRLCGLVVRILGYRSGGPDSIPGTTREIKWKERILSAIS